MRKRKLVLVVIGIILFNGTNTLFAQEEDLFGASKHKIGFTYSYGSQNLFNVKYYYHVNVFQLQYLYTLSHKPALGIDFLVQPQYNVSKFRHISDIPIESGGFEFGLNAGILLRKNLIKGMLNLYTFISSGPHYVSRTPARQANRFIFSSNISVGLHIKLEKNLYLDLRSGLRHISNAGISKSNAGINNLVIGGGVLIPIL